MTSNPVTEAARKDDEGSRRPQAIGAISKTQRGFHSAQFPAADAPEDAR
jgi:hypothetical protein